MITTGTWYSKHCWVISDERNFYTRIFNISLVIITFIVIATASVMISVSAYNKNITTRRYSLV